MTALSALNPTADSVDLVQDAIVRSGSKYHPFLDAFNGSLALAGVASYGQITLPAIQSGEEVPVRIQQKLQVTDLDAFTKYNVALLGEVEITQTLKGNTWLHEGSLPPIFINYDKTVTMKGSFPSLCHFPAPTHNLQDSTNYLVSKYRTSPSNSHPNPTALICSDLSISRIRPL